MLKEVSKLAMFIEDFWSLIFPNTCLHCRQPLKKNESQICTTCLISFPVTDYHQSINDNPLFNDLKIIQNVTFATAYLHYNKFGVAQTLLHQLKYRGNYEVGILLGEWYSSHLVEAVTGDVIIPVPIHPEKLKTRGYNQSDAIAEGLRYHLRIPVEKSAITRVKKTLTQTKREKVSRWLALQDAFEVINPQALTKKRIILVDDVITTGSTIAALCEEINRFEPESIQIVAIATGK